jgi:hypothetical protein
MRQFVKIKNMVIYYNFNLILATFNVVEVCISGKCALKCICDLYNYSFMLLATLTN